MKFLLLQTLNSFALGSLLFLLSSGFSLIFGLMRVANLAHGSFFMLGAYFAFTLTSMGLNFWVALVGSAAATAVLGGLFERLILRRLAGRQLSQVLLTLGVLLISADFCLLVWGGDPLQLQAPAILTSTIRIFDVIFPLYRIGIIVLAIAVFVGLFFLLERTRLGAMIRAGVDDMQMARGLGIPVSRLFTIVFCLGTGLAGLGGVIGAPITAVYPGLDTDMLPLALMVVILGGIGSLPGAFIGSLIIGFVDTFGRSLVPDLAYVILFLPMLITLAVRPRGLFGRVEA